MSSCNCLLLDRLKGIAGEILECVEIGWGSDVVEDSEVAANIAYAASTLGSFNAKPSVAYLSVAKHIMHYFKHSAKLGVTCKHSDSSSLTGYTDANFFHSGSATVNIGYICKIADGAVTWRSKKVKPAIPQLTAEAKLYALNAGICELL